MILARCANHDVEECSLCGTYVVTGDVDHVNAAILTELAYQARIAAAAIDYTHGRITITQLVRIAKDTPR